MPVYTFKFTVPANTSESSPIVEEIEIEGYVLEEISVLIPSGHFALAHMQIRYGLKNIVPWGENQWVSGDSETVVFHPWWILPETPCTLKFVGWNEDDTWDHSFYVRLMSKWKHELLPSLIARSFLEGLKRLFGLL